MFFSWILLELGKEKEVLNKYWYNAETFYIELGKEKEVLNKYWYNAENFYIPLTDENRCDRAKFYMRCKIVFPGKTPKCSYVLHKGR